MVARSACCCPRVSRAGERRGVSRHTHDDLDAGAYRDIDSEPHADSHASARSDAGSDLNASSNADADADRHGNVRCHRRRTTGRAWHADSAPDVDEYTDAPTGGDEYAHPTGNITTTTTAAAA